MSEFRNVFSYEYIVCPVTDKFGNCYKQNEISVQFSCPLFEMLHNLMHVCRNKALNNCILKRQCSLISLALNGSFTAKCAEEEFAFHLCFLGTTENTL
jgi:hypothetical protein